MMSEFFVEYIPYKTRYKTKRFLFWTWEVENTDLTPLGPTPQKAKLLENFAYRVKSVNDYSSETEAFFAIINDYGQMFWMSNRYFRFVTDVNESNKYLTNFYLRGEKSKQYISNQSYVSYNEQTTIK